MNFPFSYLMKYAQYNPIKQPTIFLLIFSMFDQATAVDKESAAPFRLVKLPEYRSKIPIKIRYGV